MPLPNLDIDKLELEITGLRRDRTKWKSRGTQTMKDFRTEMETKYTYLAEKSVGLFEMAIKGVLNNPVQEAKMCHMLGLMRSAQSGQRSLKSAEKQFGQENFEEYVQPIVDRLDDEDRPATCNLMENDKATSTGPVSSTPTTK